MRNQNKQCRQYILLAAIAAIFLLGAVGSTFAQPGSGAKYGSRDLTTCADTKAPAKGAITAELAAQYARCNQEKADRDNIWLLEDLKIKSAQRLRMIRKLIHYPADIDVKAPVYPLRGSYQTYACAPISDEKGGETEEQTAPSFQHEGDGRLF